MIDNHRVANSNQNNRNKLRKYYYEQFLFDETIFHSKNDKYYHQQNSLSHDYLLVHQNHHLHLMLVRIYQHQLPLYVPRIQHVDIPLL